MEVENGRGQNLRVWEILLVVECLDQPLKSLAEEARSLRISPPSSTRTFQESSGIMDDGIVSIEFFAVLLDEVVATDLVHALGPSGPSGNASTIQTACADTLDICREMFLAESSIVTTSLHPDFHEAQNQVSGFTLDLLTRLTGLVSGLREVAEAGRSGSYQFTLAFNIDHLENLPLPTT